MGKFLYFGPLQSNSPMFRGRKNELAVLTKICSGPVESYAIVYGGRQTGKTSLFYHLMDLLSASTSICTCYINYQGTNVTSTAAALQFLAQCVADEFPALKLDPDVKTSTALQEFLRLVMQGISPKRLVLMMEELGGLSPVARLDLANVIRAIFTNRFSPKYRPFRELVFVLSGNLELYDLADGTTPKGPEVSPLSNVCTEIYLPDLLEEDAVSLVCYGLQAVGLPEMDVRQLGKDIYDQVSGHPYLTQRIGGMLEDKFTSGQNLLVSDLPKVIDEFCISDNFLNRLYHKVISTNDNQVSLESACRELLYAQEPIPFSRLIPEMARLEQIGLISHNKDNQWVLRNHLFEREMKKWFQPDSHHIDSLIQKLRPTTHHSQMNLAIVRIYARAGGPIGAGFLVADDLVLTCGHVVSAALGHAESMHGDISLDWPLVDPGHILSADILALFPARNNGQGDIAVLRLKEPPPSGAESIRFVASDNVWNHNFRAFGFPRGHELGVWVSGVLRDQNASAWLQIEDTKEPGFGIRPGFSGTPVWDEEKKGVVGMVVAAEVDPDIKAAYIIASNRLLATLALSPGK
jgi:hypothetical protein